MKLLQNQQNIDLNILVVDNDSPNDSYKYLVDNLKNIKNVEVIKSEKNGGYAYGNNYGLRHIKDKEFDFVIISNNDILLDDEQLIYKLTCEYNKLKSPAFIAPAMKNNDKVSKNTAWKIPSLKDDIYSTLRVSRLILNTNILYKLDGKSTLKVDCLPGSFFISKKNIFYDIGLYDEKTFLYGEERIIAYKVKQCKLQSYLVQSYEHYTSQTISKEVVSSQMMRYLFSSRYYFHKTYRNVSQFKLAIYLLSTIENKLVSIMKGFKKW